MGHKNDTVDSRPDEIARLSGYLQDLGQGGDVTYEGEDRDWLLGLTKVATREGCYVGMACCVVFLSWAILSQPSNRMVNFGGPRRLVGKFIDVLITAALPHSLRGEAAVALH